MSFAKIVLRTKSNLLVLSRNISESAGGIVFNQPPVNQPADNTLQIPQVPGLSEAVVKDIPEKFVPGTSKSGGYKNPEYFSYHKNSYFEAEIEMLQYRCPQPSALEK